MATLIVPVGTSILDNAAKKMKERGKEIFKTIKQIENRQLRWKDYDENKKLVNPVEKFLQDYINDYVVKSAELDTIELINKKLREDKEKEENKGKEDYNIGSIKLIITDTLIGRVCGDALKNVLEKKYNKVNVPPIHITGLHVWDRKEFNKALKQIFRVFRENYDLQDKILFVISGGYKVLIPYLSILAQIIGRNIYYVFENTNELIEILPLEIRFDYEKLKDIVLDLIDIANSNDFAKGKEYNGNIQKYIETDTDDSKTISAINPFGELMLEKFINNYGIIFYATSEVNLRDRDVVEGIKKLHEDLMKAVGLANSFKYNPCNDLLCHERDKNMNKKINIPSNWHLYKSMRKEIRLLYKKDKYVLYIGWHGKEKEQEYLEELKRRNLNNIEQQSYTPYILKRNNKIESLKKEI